MPITRPTTFPRFGEVSGSQGVIGPNEAEPSSGKKDIGWIAGEEPPCTTFNWLHRLTYDWLQYLDTATTAPPPPLFETFDGATFPPATSAGWTAPSARYPTDAAYVRDTVSPIMGAASANRPGTQGVSSSSSIGAAFNLYSPSRIAFVFDLLCNASFGDHLDFYIDGVLVGKWSTTTNATVSAGRFVSDVLDPGAHTLDWRFVRGASASVAGEKARIDAVSIIPESAWNDFAKRTAFDDDFLTTSLGAGAVWQGNVIVGSGGTSSSGITDTALGMGVYQIVCGAIGPGDTQQLFGPQTSFLTQPSYFPFIETLLDVPSLANVYVAFGLVDNVVTMSNGVLWVYDSSVGTDWRILTMNGGVATTNPTGIAAVAGVTRLGLSGATGLANGNGWLGMINGQAVPGAGANHPGSTQNLPPATQVLKASWRVGSRGIAVAKTLNMDYFKLRSLRGTTLL